MKKLLTVPLLKKNKEKSISRPDHRKEIHRLNRLIGQMNGVSKMIEDGKYCPEILIQTKAIVSSIRSLETVILEKHIQCCVKKAIQSNKGSDDKIAELVTIFKTRIK